MPFTRPRMTRPLPWTPRRVRPLRSARLAGGNQVSLTYRLSTWGFDAQVYISFDGPTAANPAWLDVTGFVEIESSTITITRGRSDGLSDVSAGTCALTVDNSDGRWTATNPAGAWFGLIRKGVWLRVDLLPPSGVVSRRFTGFITSLPTGWAGLYATTRITASDRFLLLGQAAQLPAMTSAEVLFDTSTAPVVAAHYPLSEASGALSFGDITGNLSAPLMPVPWGSTSTALLKAGAVPAPGFDGQQAVQFTPAALAQGTVLTTTVQSWNNYLGSPSKNYGVLELWLQTTFTGVSQAFASLWDPGGACALTYTVDGPTGYLSLGIEATTATSAFGNVAVGTMIPGTTVVGGLVQAGVVLNDGNWHYISIAVVAAQNGGSLSFVINIDGKTIWIAGLGASISTALNTLVIGGGFAGTSLQNFTGNLAGTSWILTGNRASNYPAHYAAGQNGFYGEQADQRIARVARYAGIPQPTTLQIPAPGYNPVPVYSGSYGPWTNLSACVHQVGTQSVVGRQPLDVMREAARTENMPLYIDRSGYLTIQPCTARYNTPGAWSVSALDVEDSTAFTDDFTYTINQMTVTPNGQASQTVIGTAGLASQARYGVYAQSIASASLHTTEAANLGLAAIAAGADPAPRLAPLVLIANTLASQAGYGNAWYDAVLASDVSSVIAVTDLPSQAPAPSLSVFEEGYTETIGAGQHVFSYSCSPQTNTAVYTCDSPTLGLIDTPGISLPY